MMFIYLLNKVMLFIAVSFTIGFVIGFIFAYIKGYRSGFNHGSFEVTKRTIFFMEEHGSLGTYCDALSNYARRRGFSEEAISKLMKETEELFSLSQEDENARAKKDIL